MLRALDEQESARDRAIAYTLLFTGLRTAELVALELPDLRLGEAGGRLIVHRTAGTSPREVPLHAPPRPVLRAWLGERRRWSGADRTGALFLNRRGGRLTARSVVDLVARLGEQAGLTELPDGGRLTPRALRHSFGASLLAAGADLVLVAALMGHKRLPGPGHGLNASWRGTVVLVSALRHTLVPTTVRVRIVKRLPQPISRSRQPRPDDPRGCPGPQPWERSS